MGSPQPASGVDVTARFVLSLVLAVGGLQAGGGDLVELDVVVTDKDNRVVPDLAREDFTIKEDGRAVDVKTFEPASSGRDEGRPIVLLLDDSSVPFSGTSIVQAIAGAVLARKAPEDEVTVVRLNNERDEPFGDVDTARSRIAGYRGGAAPFEGRGTAARAMNVIAAISRQLEHDGRRRKLIVCIGGPRVCNGVEPRSRYGDLWRPWVGALAATARANAAVYAIMPVWPAAPVAISDGLAGLTGGREFTNRSNFERFVEHLWDEAGRYYLLGYWPAGSKRELHTIDVRVARKGVRVQARRYRGG